MRKTALKKSELRIVFMGTPEFAVGTLKALLANKYNVVGVVTQPDKAVGRHGSVLQPSAVKQYANRMGIPVESPEKMRDPKFLHQLMKWNANLQVVVAFRMLPEVVWNMPKYGTFNVHAALLPQYRGAAPINWAIINGEKETGATTFFVDSQIDTGRIIKQVKYQIKSNYTYRSVYNGLMRVGAKLCIETIDEIRRAKGFPQTSSQINLLPNESHMLYNAPKIFKETCEINWEQTAEQVYNFVRGLYPRPVAWTTLRDEKGHETVIKIYKVAVPKVSREVPSGAIIVENKKLYIAAKDGKLVEIIELQMAGKKKMSAKDFLNGCKNITESHCFRSESSV